MPLERIVVDTTDVSPGMYVAMLDRPWLDTPFVFQGFEIRDKVEVELLQSYCRFVYIDVERSNLSAAAVRTLVASRKTRVAPKSAKTAGTAGEARWKTWMRRIVFRLGLGRLLTASNESENGEYRISSTVRAEAAVAKKAYELLSKRQKFIFERAAINGRVNIDRVKQAVLPTIESILRNPNAMVWTVFSRKQNRTEYNRAVATSVWAIMFGRQLGFEREALINLAVGGLLLDIGNAKLSPDVLNAEGSITAGQHEYLSRHVHLGLDILEASSGMEQDVFDMVQGHHERDDGSGYPNQLTGNAISIYGRIAGIVDADSVFASHGCLRCGPRT